MPLLPSLHVKELPDYDKTVVDEFLRLGGRITHIRDPRVVTRIPDELFDFLDGDVIELQGISPDRPYHLSGGRVVTVAYFEYRGICFTGASVFSPEHVNDVFGKTVRRQAIATAIHRLMNQPATCRLPEWTEFSEVQTALRIHVKQVGVMGKQPRTHMEKIKLHEMLTHNDGLARRAKEQTGDSTSTKSSTE